MKKSKSYEDKLRMSDEERVRIEHCIGLARQNGVWRTLLACLTHEVGGKWRINRSERACKRYAEGFSVYRRGDAVSISLEQLSADTLDYQDGYKLFMRIRQYLQDEKRTYIVTRTRVAAEVLVSENAVTTWFIRHFVGGLQRTVVEYSLLFDAGLANTPVPARKRARTSLTESTKSRRSVTFAPQRGTDAGSADTSSSDSDTMARLHDVTVEVSTGSRHSTSRK